MEWINNLLPGQLVSAIGITILHSLWQGFIISIFLTLALVLLRKSEAKVRYILSCTALLMILTAALVTFYSSYETRDINKTTLSSKVYLNESNLDKDGKITLSLNTTDENNSFSISKYAYMLKSYLSDYTPEIALLWFIGIIFFTLKMLGGFLYTQRIKHHKVFVPEEEWQMLVEKLASKIEIKRTVTLLESAIVKVPMLIGHFKPVILMPLGLLSGLSIQEIEAVLAHELAHIKRFDYILNILQNIIEVIFFYNPAVWWISGIIKREREHVCDDVAVSMINNKWVYSKALINLRDSEITQNEYAMTLFKKKNELLGRIKRMISQNKTSNVSGQLVSIFFIMLITVVMVSACSSVSDDYSYEYGDEYAAFVKDYPRGRHTLHFEDENDNNWRVRLNNGEIVSVHKNGERLSRSEIRDVERFLKKEIKKTHRNYCRSNNGFVHINNKFDFDMQEFHEDMRELQEELRDIHVNTKVHFDDSDLKESLEQLKHNLKNIRVNIDDDDIRFRIDDDFNFDFNFDEDLDIDIDLGDFGERMGEFGECMGKMGEDLKDFNVDMDEFEESMEEFGETMDELGLNMHDLKREMKKLKQFLLEVKEELIDDGYIDDMDDDITLEFDDGYLYIDNREVDDSVRRKYEDIYRKYYDDEPDDNWRLEL